MGTIVLTLNEHDLYHDPVMDAKFVKECKCTDDWNMRIAKFGEQVFELSELMSLETAEENDGDICPHCNMQEWVILPAQHELVIQKRLLNELEREGALCEP